MSQSHISIRERSRRRNTLFPSFGAVTALVVSFSVLCPSVSFANPRGENHSPETYLKDFEKDFQNRRVVPREERVAQVDRWIFRYEVTLEKAERAGASQTQLQPLKSFLENLRLDRQALHEYQAGVFETLPGNKTLEDPILREKYKRILPYIHNNEEVLNLLLHTRSPGVPGNHHTRSQWGDVHQRYIAEHFDRINWDFKDAQTTEQLFNYMSYSDYHMTHRMDKDVAQKFIPKLIQKAKAGDELSIVLDHSWRFKSGGLREILIQNGELLIEKQFLNSNQISSLYRALPQEYDAYSEIFQKGLKKLTSTDELVRLIASIPEDMREANVLKRQPAGGVLKNRMIAEFIGNNAEEILKLKTSPAGVRALLQQAHGNRKMQERFINVAQRKHPELKNVLYAGPASAESCVPGSKNFFAVINGLFRS